MIRIDGSKGGGQMLRTALTLSAIRGESFKIKNIRGNRNNPGLKRQHLKCVETVERLCNAEVEGAEQGSEELIFKPGELSAENFTVNIGTAGSLTLLLDTVLPLATQFDKVFRLTVKGGTDVKWSPAFEYLRQVKLPLLEQFGFKADLELESSGFYPEGGGEATLKTEEFSMEPVVLKRRGELQGFELFSKASRELEEQRVADRQAGEAARKLKNSHVSRPVEKTVDYEETASVGSSLVLKAVYEESLAGFDALGERGKSSEEVAKEAVKQFKSFSSTDAAVDRHMADQLIIFLAVVGGEICVPEVTDHIQTSLEVVEAFGCDVRFDSSEVVRIFK